MSAAFSASGFFRADQCPPSCALPVADHDTKAAGRGRARHKFLALIADGVPRDDALGELTSDERTECEGIDIRSVPIGGETEVAMAFDVVAGTARRLVVDGHRQYEVTDTEIPGTADLIEWPKDHSRLAVIDWKGCLYGQDSDEVDAQLSLYGLMAARLIGVDEVKCRVGTIGDHGGIGWRSFVLDWEDLAAVAERARRTHARVQVERQRVRESGYTPDVKLGKHCRYCNAARYCPATIAMVRMFTTGNVPEVTPENLADMYAGALAAEKAAGWARDRARELIERLGPLPLPDGRVVTLDRRRYLAVRKSA